MQIPGGGTRVERRRAVRQAHTSANKCGCASLRHGGPCGVTCHPPPVARTASTGQAEKLPQLPDGQTCICERSQASQNDQAANEGDQPADGDGGARHGVGWAAGRGRGNRDALWSTISDTASGVHQCSWRGERGGVAGEHARGRAQQAQRGRSLRRSAGAALHRGRRAERHLHAHFGTFAMTAC